MGIKQRKAWTFFITKWFRTILILIYSWSNLCQLIPRLIVAALIMSLRFPFPTKWNCGSLYSSKRVCRIRANTGLLSDEFHCQRQIWSKSLAMDLQRVSHSDNFHNILCNPQGQIFFSCYFSLHLLLFVSTPVKCWLLCWNTAVLYLPSFSSL